MSCTTIPQGFLKQAEGNILTNTVATLSGNSCIMSTKDAVLLQAVPNDLNTCKRNAKVINIPLPLVTGT